MRPRLLNFKMDHSSIRVFDGVDYEEKKKEKDQELKQLMLNEITMEQSRRTRQGVSYTEVTKEEGSNHHKTPIVRLPSMFPFQVRSAWRA